MQKNKYEPYSSHRNVLSVVIIGENKLLELNRELFNPTFERGFALFGTARRHADRITAWNFKRN